MITIYYISPKMGSWGPFCFIDDVQSYVYSSVIGYNVLVQVLLVHYFRNSQELR